ncbi:MAG: hypothetical protein IKZ87_00865, partial [Actinomycetaceae bacterium]|nr:hypothetical protein [Actinomycetaceae bacterium]
PQAEAPQAEAPQAEAPQAEAPQAEAPQAEAPSAEQDSAEIAEMTEALQSLGSTVEATAYSGYLDDVNREFALAADEDSPSSYDYGM